MTKRLAVAVAVAALLLGGCASDTVVEDLLSGRKIDYEKDQESRRRGLLYPPDLIAADKGAQGTVSFSQYKHAGVPEIAEAQIDDAPAAGVEYKRDGNVRWVRLQLPAEEAWPRARDFWLNHMGFDLEREEAKLGLMETPWLDLRRVKLEAPGFRAQLNKLLGIVADSGERDKFLTRLERDGDATEIYITHRRASAQYASGGGFAGYLPQAGEPQLEVEMLRRLMLYFAGAAATDKEEDGQSADAQARRAAIEGQVAAGEAAAPVAPYSLQGDRLVINKPFDDAWRLAQIGLERGGFSIEDRDYGEGIIYIRHSGGPESEKVFGEKPSGFFDRLFSPKEPVLRDIQLRLQAGGEGGEGATVITAEALPGEPALTSGQAEFVLRLLRERLP